MTKFYRIISTIVRPFCKWIYRIEVRGAENIPEEGAILAANHTAFSDVIVISAACNRQIRYMAKKELFKTPLKPLITALGAFPVNRGGTDLDSIRRSVSLIGEGELLGIFPQGHRYGGQDPRMTEVKPGVGFLAYHTKATVVPCLISNGRMKTGIFRRNIVTFGKPIPVEELGFPETGKPDYKAAADHIFARICSAGENLLPEKTETEPSHEPENA